MPSPLAERTPILLILYLLPAARFRCSDEPKLSPVASNWKVLLPSPDSIVIPPPSACVSSADPSATIIFLSLIVTVVESTMVSVPVTWKSPLITTLPVLSPIPAGSMFITEGPEMVVELILIADASAPVWNSVAVTTPDTFTESSSV